MTKHLTDLEVRRKAAPGTFIDAAGLYLQVSPTLTKSWVFRFTLDARAREMGLGPYPLVSLSEARRRRDDARLLLLDGIDPIEHRKSERARRRLEEAKQVTFQQAAVALITAKRPGWGNVKHAAQWDASLKSYVYPVLGSLPVGAIDTGLVMRVLEPIWTTKPETGSWVRGRIEAILNWAKTHGFRDGENPARWRGHLENLLAKKSKLQKVEHHAALPYGEVAAFMARLREREGTSARALEFLILTATRTSETLNAVWDEINIDQRMWVISCSRMKAGREHRIPLSEAAVSLLGRLPRQGHLVFPGHVQDRPFSNTALPFLLRRLGRGDITIHGFRSSFRDWGAEQTAYPNELLEVALAHTVGDKVEAAYRRGDMIEKRRRLMEDWGRYCGSIPAVTTDNVIRLRTDMG